MEAFVTGGTGFLGNNLVRQLVFGGHHVTAVVRSREKADRLLGDLDVTIVEGDMRDVDGFADHLDGCEVLFHTAAYFREYYRRGDRDDSLHRINVDATIDLLDAADAAGVGRVVYVSSAGVVGRKPNGDPGDESTPPGDIARTNGYFRSKVEADRAVERFCQSHDLSVVTVLPGWMFGPGDAAPTDAGRLVVDLVSESLPAVFDGGGVVADVRDVADAMIVAAERGETGERYIVGGPYTDLREIAATLSTITGCRTPRHLPYRAVMAFAALSETMARLRNRETTTTRQGVSTMGAKLLVDSSNAERELGATFRPLSETLRDEVAWFRAEGYLPPESRQQPTATA